MKRVDGALLPLARPVAPIRPKEGAILAPGVGATLDNSSMSMPTSQVATTAEKRHVATNRPELSGITVREDDVEPVRGLRSIVVLFRGMAILLLLLMVVQVFLGITSTVPLSIGVVLAEAV